MRAVINDSKFMKDMQNVIRYSEGFLDGVKLGKTTALRKIGQLAIEYLKEFIDSNARVNPESLHHVYEWYQTGSPSARLFDIEYTSNSGGISLNATFRQSTVAKAGQKPFYDKARIMEEGIPVTITPQRARVLSFIDNGEEVFTPGPINVANPGGPAVAGSFQRIIDTFINQYFSQAFLSASGIRQHLEFPMEYKRSLKKATMSGRAAGVSAGYKWITDVGGNV